VVKELAPENRSSEATHGLTNPSCLEERRRVCGERDRRYSTERNALEKRIQALSAAVTATWIRGFCWRNQTTNCRLQSFTFKNPPWYAARVSRLCPKKHMEKGGGYENEHELFAVLFLPDSHLSCRSLYGSDHGRDGAEM
jgi:hypothetical protein